MQFTDSTAKSTTVRIDEDVQFTDAVSVGKLATVDVSEIRFDDAFSEVKTIGVALSEDLVFSDSVGITKSVTQEYL